MATVKQQRRRVWIWQARKKTENPNDRNERHSDERKHPTDPRAEITPP